VNLRETYRQRLLPLRRSNGRRVILVGTGEVAEIAALVLWELDLTLEQVVDDEKPGATFLGHKVSTLAKIPEVSFDWIVLAVLDGSEGLRVRLHGFQIPDERIVALHDKAARSEGSATDGVA